MARRTLQMRGKETPGNRSAITCLQVTRPCNGFYWLLLHHIKETKGTYQHGPASLDIQPFSCPERKKSIQKDLTFHQTLSLKILKQSYLCAHYFWQSPALSQSIAKNSGRLALVCKCPLRGWVRLHEAVWLCGGRGSRLRANIYFCWSDQSQGP